MKKRTIVAAMALMMGTLKTGAGIVSGTDSEGATQLPESAGLLVGYDFENPEEVNRGYLPELLANGVTAGLFKSSFVDRPHYHSETLGDGVGDNTGLPFDVDAAADRSIAFRESEWGMDNLNADQDAIDLKWYFEFTVGSERHRRLSISNLCFSAQMANPGKSADRWFLTSSIDGFSVAAALASGDITASSTNDDPSADADFQDVAINLGALSRFQNLSRDVTFRLYWVANNANTNNDSFNMTWIDKVGVFGTCIDTSVLATNTYRVADFGALGNGSADDGPAIREAFAAAASQPNPAVVVFATNAVYRFGKYNAEFNQIPIKYTQDLTVEGNGSTLLINPENRSFLVWRCKDVAIRGFDIDFDSLPFTQGEVLSVDAPSGTFVFQIANGYSDVVPVAVEALIADWDNAVFVDAATGNFTHNWVLPEHLAPVVGYSGRYQVAVVADQYSKLNEVAPGQVFILNRHADLLDGINREKKDELGYYYSIGSFTFVIRHSRNISVEDVNLYAFSGRAYSILDSVDVDLNRISVMRKPGTDRAVSGVRGGIIMKELRGGPVILNSHLEATMDDSMNRSESPCFLMSVSNRVATLRFSDNKWSDSIDAAGDTVEFWDRVNSTLLGTATVVETIRDSHRNHRTLFDYIPAGVKTTNDVLLNQATLLCRVVEGKTVVSNCTFGTQLKKAFICRPPARIENCSFEESNYGVHAYVVSDAEEGPYPRNQEYLNLRFKNVGIGAIVLYKPGAPSGVGNQNIRIDNVYIYQDGSAMTPANGISITGMNGVTVSNTTIRFAADVDPSPLLFTVNNSINVVQSKNYFVDERLPSTDTDSDGLPDWWETAYFGGIGNTADADSDGDGATDLEEYRAATNPDDSGSVFKMASYDLSGSGATLAWGSTYGRTYSIQQCTNLVLGAWGDLATNQIPTPPLNSFTGPIPSADRVFLRIRTAP